jgi:predicted flap endonuclease-1-like 5' DNA nuclease
MIKKQIRKERKGYMSFILLATFIVIFTTIFALTGNAQTDTTRPTIVSVEPMNNQQDVQIDDVITVKFSEKMDYRTINKDTFIVYQRTTPSSDSPLSESRFIQRKGIVTYEGYTATFTPISNEFQPNQRYGNVFTVTITTGVKDLSGNSISRNYVWSFTTGSSVYNTGTSTSQLDQSATPVITPGTTTTTQPLQQLTQIPIVTNTQTSSNNSFWLWLIVGALILIVILAIMSLALKQKDKKLILVSKSSSLSKPHPFGDIHNVMDLEGIGHTYKKALNKIGITDTKQLWTANAFYVSKQVGVPIATVKSWQNMAELASVKDIGPQYAELLERSGVHNIRELKTYDVKELLKLVQKKQASLKINIQGNTPGDSLVSNWIEQAKDHRFVET